MGKHVLVTGATRGIGRGITTALLKNNFKVTGTSHKSAFPKEFNSNLLFNGVNIDLNDIDTLQKNLHPLFGKENVFDVVVNNAGVSFKQSIDSDDENWLSNWDYTLSVNLRSAGLISKWAVSSWLRNENKGILINIASRAAHRGDTGDFISYAASKGGLSALTKTVARSYGKQNITAFDIAPGFVHTEMMEQVKETYPEGYIENELALENMVKPLDIGHLVVFIAGDKAQHLTGQTLHVNSGSHIF